MIMAKGCSKEYLGCLGRASGFKLQGQLRIKGLAVILGVSCILVQGLGTV